MMKILENLQNSKDIFSFRAQFSERCASKHLIGTKIGFEFGAREIC